jgi:hypothetical protein
MTEPAETSRYRHRTPEVEAVQWTGSNAAQLRAFAGNDFATIDPEDRIDDPDQDAQVLIEASYWTGISPGWWVLKYVDHFDVERDETFRAGWEPAAAGVAPAADQTERRERYAAAVQRCAEEGNVRYERIAEAVMAVADAEHAQARESWKASLRRADKLNNQLMEEVQRYAAGTERPVLWSVYNAMHLRAAAAENVIERVVALADRWENALAPDQAYARSLRAALDVAEPPAAPPAADRAAVLREAAVFVEAMNEGCGQAKPCASCDAREDVAAELRRMADEAQQQPDAHVYLSTGCFHGDEPFALGLTGHEYCQNKNGVLGAKKAARCKGETCNAPCICPCHREATEQQPAAADTGEEPTS